MSKKRLLTVVVALSLPVFVHAATYDDLITAAKMGDAQEIASLTARGASVDTTDIDGNTLLMLAARDGHAGVVEMLIQQRAKLNARNSDGDSALRLAAFRGHQKVVELLLAAGATFRTIRGGRRWPTPPSPATWRLPGCCSRPAPISTPPPKTA